MANTFTLQRFRSQISTFGLARDNNYRVMFDGPAALISDSQTPNLLTFYCNQMSIPPKHLESSPVRIAEAYYEMPFGVSFEPITLNFYVDQGYLIRKFFINWQNIIRDSTTDGMGFRDDYAAGIKLIALNKGRDGATLLDDDARITYQVQVVGAFPKTIGDVQYSASNQGNPLSMAVLFHCESITENVTASISNPPSAGLTPQPVAY